MTFCNLCDKDTKFESVHYPNGTIILECVQTHFKCQDCGAKYSKADHFDSHKEIHKIESTWNGIDFEKSTDPQNLEDFRLREIAQEREHAKKGVMYGSACWTDFMCCCDGLEDAFNGVDHEDGSRENPMSVEDGLYKCAIMGYDVGSFGYILSPDEIKEHRRYSKRMGMESYY